MLFAKNKTKKLIKRIWYRILFVGTLVMKIPLSAFIIRDQSLIYHIKFNLFNRYKNTVQRSTFGIYCLQELIGMDVSGSTKDDISPTDVSISIAPNQPLVREDEEFTMF